MTNELLVTIAVFGIVFIGVEVQIVRLEQRVKKLEGDKK